MSSIGQYCIFRSGFHRLGGHGFEHRHPAKTSCYQDGKWSFQGPRHRECCNTYALNRVKITNFVKLYLRSVLDIKKTEPRFSFSKVGRLNDTINCNFENVFWFINYKLSPTSLAVLYTPIPSTLLSLYPPLRYVGCGPQVAHSKSYW